ncbi:hypothetical protein CS542_05175 [Pedobacter sp. IW39]|nr:hypothetical protein CS542_05175 [Pedobacter sp. IW39]
MSGTLVVDRLLKDKNSYYNAGIGFHANLKKYKVYNLTNSSSLNTERRSAKFIQMALLHLQFMIVLMLKQMITQLFVLKQQLMACIFPRLRTIMKTII